MDNHRDVPATKGDLTDAVNGLEARLTEAIHDSETRLLKAFYTFAETNQKRLAEGETESAAIKGRLATVEQRLLEVEKRLNMPPQQ
jgi:hypothetical protein